MDATHTIDVRGKLCPVPLIMTMKKLKQINKGEVLEVITETFVSKENIERFGKEKHELLRIDVDGELFKIYIKK
jgi:TusA-related sulfurtransferase